MVAVKLKKFSTAASPISTSKNQSKNKEKSNANAKNESRDKLKESKKDSSAKRKPGKNTDARLNVKGRSEESANERLD